MKRKPDSRLAIKLFADFYDGEMDTLEFSRQFDYYPEGDIMRLDLLKDACYMLQEQYNKELGMFPPKETK